MYRCALAWLLSASAWAGTAELSWTAPTQNVDGSAYTNPGGYRVYRRCDTGALAQIADVPHAQRAYTDTLDVVGTCWWSLTAYNTLGEESARTNEVSKSFAAAPVDLPGSVSATFTWSVEQGSPMALAFTSLEAGRDATLTGASDTATTGSITCPADSVTYIAVAVAQGSAGADLAPTVSSITGASLTWTSMARQVYGSRRSVSVFRAVNTGSETSGALTINMSSAAGGALQEAAWSIVRVTGADTADPDDAAVTGSASSGTSLNLADVGTLDTDDQVFAAFGFESGADSFALAAGLTEIGSVTGGANVRSLKTGYGTDETPGATWGTSGNGIGGIGFIVNVGSGGGLGATVNRAAESDAAQAVARSKSKAIGQPAEADLAQAAARYKSRVAALVAETDTAQAIAKAKARSAPQAAETDSARTITPSGAPVGGTVTQAAETDSARAFSTAKAKAIGQAAELELGQAIARMKAKAIGRASETDAAQGATPAGVNLMRQAIEADLAQSLGKAKAKAIANALETDSARAIAAARAYAVGRASETDAAIAVAAIGKALALGVATEQDIARAFTVSGGAPVDFYYLREALEMAAASIIAALANTTVTVDVGGAGETSGVVAIQQERSFDPGLPGLRMASTSTEFLLEKKTAPASLKQGTLIRDETSSETYRVRRLNYNRGGIVTVEIERV